MMADSELDTIAFRIILADSKDFELGGVHVRPAHREVSSNGDRRELEPRVMQVLVALAKSRPDVVSRDKLIETCWDGRIVGDDALNRCVVALRQLAREFTPQPFAIETVARVGYSLVEAPCNGPESSPSSTGFGLKFSALALLGLALLAVGLAIAWTRSIPEDGPASIAVLPFRNLSGGDAYFAEGVGEEILGQLGRQPQFRVAGAGSSRLLAETSDVTEVARRLNVDYILAGSVRTQDDQVRVNAHLVRGRDGVQLWSESYDGSLDDIFGIQQRIGVGIAEAMNRRLVGAQPIPAALATTGEAYNLYLTARGLIRTSNRRVGATATNLLRDAINLDPTYAPAWAALAVAVRLDGAMSGHEAFITATEQAQHHARHALRLAPDLPEAHRTLGMIQGYGTPEAQAHLRRAVELDPTGAETLLWAGVAHGAAGEFAEELTAYRRALHVDPLWFRSVKHTAVAVAEMGNRPEAEAIVMRGHHSDAISRNLALGRIAWIFGDYSEAVRRWTFVARSNSPRWADTARRSINDATFAVGLPTDALVSVPPPDDLRRATPIWIHSTPASSEWLARNRSRIAAEVFRDENHKAAKLMLRAGRAREIIAAFDGEVGLFGLRRGTAPRVDQLHEVPVIIVALRAVGRAAEAERLLAQASELIGAIYRRGAVPFWFDVDGAAIRALQRRNDEALSMLERALIRGWTHTGNTDLSDIADEPAFTALAGSQRFSRIQNRLSHHLARERRETRQLRI